MSLDRRAILKTALGASAASFLPTATWAQAKLPLFDSHAHLTTGDIAHYPVGPIGGGHLREGEMDNLVTPETLIGWMNASGVKRAVAVQKAHMYGYDNSFVADSATKYPDRFTFTVSLNAQDPKAPETMRHWVKEKGAAGIRLAAIGPDTEPTAWFASTEADAVWRTAAELGVPVCLHMFRNRRRDVQTALAPIAEKYSSIPIVIDHIGNASIEDGAPEYGIDTVFLTLQKRPNVYIKFVSINLALMRREGKPIQTLFRRLVDVFGADRMMWGSDIGNTRLAYNDMVAMAREAVAGLTDVQQARALFGTADAIYGGKWRA